MQCRRLQFDVGSRRVPGEGIGYLLQHSWASLGAQMVKNLPAMQETWARSLGGKDPLEKEMANHPSIFVPGGFRGQRRLAIHGLSEADTVE